MFRAIEINNFRGIKTADVEGLRMINVFFGKNNCGKSSLLEALFLISGQSNPTLPLSINSIRNYTKFSDADLNLEFFNLNSDNAIEIAVKGDEDRWLRVSRIRSRSNTVDLEALNGATSDNAANVYGYKLTYTKGNKDLKYTSEFLLNDNNPDTGKSTIDKRYKEEIFSQYVTPGIEQTSLHDEFARIIEDKKESYILSTIQAVDPSIKDIQLVGTEIMIDIGVERRLPINMVGDGLRKLLYLIISIYRCRNGILLIDEIDNGFHYSAMQVLWQSILTAASENKVQIFASTHNIDSIKGLEKTLSSSVYERFRSDVSCFKLIRKSDGHMVSLKYDYESLKYAITQELEVR